MNKASLAPYRDAPCQALIVCCSDHRFAPAHRALAAKSLPAAADGEIAWLAIPGGPASLASDDAPIAAGAREQAAFILRALQPGRVLLVAHDRCAFYAQVCGVPTDRLATKQRRDLRAAADWIMRESPEARIDLTRLVVEGASVRAEPISRAD